MYALTLARPSPIWIAILLSLLFHGLFLGLLRPTFVEWQKPRLPPLQVEGLSESSEENPQMPMASISTPPSLFHYRDLLYNAKAASLPIAERALHKKVTLLTAKGTVLFPPPPFLAEYPEIYSQIIGLKWQKDDPYPFFWKIENFPIALRLELEKWLRSLAIPANLRTSSLIQEGTLYLESFYSYD